MSKESNNKQKLSGIINASQQSRQIEDQVNSNNIFSGSHAFRTIQPSQNSQPKNNINSNFAAYLQSLQQNAGNLLSSKNQLALNFRDSDYSNKNSSGVGPISCSTQMIISLFEIVEKQTLALEKLNKKVEEVVEKNTQLKKQVITLQQEKRKYISNNDSQNRQNQFLIPSPTVIQGQSVTSSDLIKILFGNTTYQYKLQLIKQMQLPLFRERNFSISIELVDLHGNRVENSNKIPMSLAIYTCQNPPKFIEKNTGGQKMLKGYVDQSLINGVCRFQKVQVRQVTSHYRGGWIFFVVIPCMPPLGGFKNQNFVQFTKIEPLVIDQVVVKAKKPKKNRLQNKSKDEQSQPLKIQKNKACNSDSDEWQADN